MKKKKTKIPEGFEFAKIPDDWNTTDDWNNKKGTESATTSTPKVDEAESTTTNTPPQKYYFYRVRNGTQMSIPLKALSTTPTEGDQIRISARVLETNDEVHFKGIVKYSSMGGRKVGYLNFKKTPHILKGYELAVFAAEIISISKKVLEHPNQVIHIN